MSFMKKFFSALVATPHRKYLLVFIVLFLLYNIPQLILSGSENLIRDKVFSELKKQGITVSSSNFRIHNFREFSFGSTIVRLPNQAPLQVDSARVKINSFLMNTSVNFTISLYGGTIQCSLEKANFRTLFPVNTNCNFQDLVLEKYPQLYALGVKGKVSGSINGVLENTIEQAQQKISVLLVNGSIDPNASPVTAILKLPPIADIQLEANGEIYQNNFSLGSGTLLSDHGKLSSLQGLIEDISSLQVSSHNAQIPPLKMTLSGILDLNEQGISKLAPWIGLAANKEIDKRPWKILVDGFIGRARLTVSELNS